MKSVYLLLGVVLCLGGCTVHTTSHVCASSCQHRAVYVGAPRYQQPVPMAVYTNNSLPFTAYQQTYNCVQLNLSTTRCYTNAPGTNGNFGWQ